MMTDQQSIEIDYCPRCRRVWLDRGEMDEIIVRSNILNTLLRLTQTMVGWISADPLPVKIDETVERLVNRNRRCWVVTLIDNEGVTKALAVAAVLNPAKTPEVAVTLKVLAGQVRRVWKWIQGEDLAPVSGLDGASVRTTISPGDVRIVEFALE